MSVAYEGDFHAWLEEQAALLKAGRLDRLDAANLAEEIESMGRSERRELFSRFKVLLAHLLKWEHQPAERSSSWRATIEEQRDQLDLLLGDSPSLRRWLPEVVAREYPRARRQAADETGLPLAAFPETCPCTPEQALDPGCWPGS